MNIYAEVDIKSAHGTEYLITALRNFGCSVNEWDFDEDKSQVYSSNLPDIKACVFIYTSGESKLGIALCEVKEGYFRIVNVTSESVGSISIDEYNQAVTAFFNALKIWNKSNEIGLRVKISNTDPDLHEIITSPLARKAFETYLNNYPLSGHPADVSRLDQFICSIARYSRKEINWEYLKYYVQEREKWTDDNIESCFNRIFIGLEVIAEYRKFR
ncbi:hypothetical protein [Aliivibrio sifiae]|uniref:Uncharacterized protein n=1 Tax=Aliivibrio sifiae TaxID=566293 RepID=A0ABQ6ANZ0_9GAMM|nr:hypothetical protein [Aliivibrio sifiae]GLR77318.1 hypothetical protein GCM10007855_41940 [Aliivibrio sifiae]